MFFRRSNLTLSETASHRPLAATSNNLYLLINDLTIFPIRFHPFCHTLQGLSQGHRIGIDHRAGNDRLLPFVLQIHLRHRDVELAMQTRDKRLDPSALFFERGAGGEVQVDGEGGEHGF